MKCKKCFHSKICGIGKIENCDSFEHINSILLRIPEGYSFNNIKNIDLNNSVLHIQIQLKHDKTVEQIANDLGFKIGNKVFHYPFKYYKGIILGFGIDKNNELYIKTDICERLYLDKEDKNWITNKVAIHVQTKEEFDFIYRNHLGRSEFEFTDEFDLIILNDDDITDKRTPAEIYKDYLILSFDEYCKSQNIELNPILFYTEDYKDGSLPLKGCNNCNHPTCGINVGDIDKCLNFNYKNWIGYGEPIRKTDKCWKVGIFNGTHVCKFDTWNGSDTNYFKYFSNEKNMKDYYNTINK